MRGTLNLASLSPALAKAMSMNTLCDRTSKAFQTARLNPMCHFLVRHCMNDSPVQLVEFVYEVMMIVVLHPTSPPP